MTIRNHFRIMTEFFDREKMNYALIGAFALHAYGYSRATRDVDFITEYAYQPRILTYLESLGFETLHYSEGFSNHLHLVGKMRIDLVYVEGQTASAVFQAARRVLVFEDLEIPVVSPEHLVLLKLFAIHNDPERKFKELGDIQELLRCQRLDLESLRSEFGKFGLEGYFDEIAANAKK